MSANQRILIIRLSHLGDVVLTLPLFHALRARFPDARIAWVTQPEFAGLLNGMVGLERVFRFHRSEGAKAWPRLAHDLAGFAATLAVVVQGNLKAAGVALCAGSARRTGLHRQDWREGLGAWVLHDCAPPVADTAHARFVPHEMDRVLALAKHVCATPAIGLRADPGLSSEERELGRHRWRELTREHGADCAVLHLAHPEDIRSWPPEHCSSLARSLAHAGSAVLVLSGPSEEALGREIERRLGTSDRIRHWVGQRGLRDLAGVFSAAAERGATYVGTDSGPMHLAAACGLRVVALAGPQSHLRTGPWPLAREPDERSRARADGHTVLVSPTAPECAPCLGRRCTHLRGPVCMSEIPPGLVAAAVRGP